MIKGIDASSVQGLLDVDRIHDAGVRFLIAKCQQGNDGKDSFFERNISAAKAKGWTVGAYHFLYPLPKLDPVKQAELFYAASTLGAYNDELPPALDLEWPDPDSGWAKYGCSPKQISAFAKVCAERMTELYAKRPMIYIYPYFAQRLAAADVAWLADYPLWIASYTKQPVIPKPWSSWHMWQYDGDGGERLPSGTDADFNYFRGDEAELAAFCRQEPFTEEARGSGPIIHPNVC